MSWLRIRLFSWVTLVFMAALWSGCSHSPPTSAEKKLTPQSLLKLACFPGSHVQSVTGAAWLRAKSKDASGQFPALIQVTSGNIPQMKLEVTKPFGGTFAVLQIQGAEYSIDVPGRKDRNRKGRDSWSGIPLVWATDLFLGKIPCPSIEARAVSRLSMGSQGELIADVPATQATQAQKFVYRFKTETRSDGKRLWPEALTWSSVNRKGEPVLVEFKFDDPEERSWSPQKWEATSTLGEVKVKWRERDPVLIAR